MPNLHLFGEVDEDMYEDARLYLDKYGVIDKVTLHTQGGDFYVGLALYDMLKEWNPTIVAVGACMSAGVVIFCAGEKRYATPSTQFMIHYGQDSNASSAEAEHNKKMLKLMSGIIHERVNVTKRTVNSWFKADTFFDHKRAVEIGLIRG